jgi:hypothetical protein
MIKSLEEFFLSYYSQVIFLFIEAFFFVIQRFALEISRDFVAKFAKKNPEYNGNFSVNQVKIHLTPFWLKVIVMLNNVIFLLFLIFSFLYSWKRGLLFFFSYFIFSYTLNFFRPLFKRSLLNFYNYSYNDNFFRDYNIDRIVHGLLKVHLDELRNSY